MSKEKRAASHAVPFLFRSWLDEPPSQRDKLYHAISHILRTPLAGVRGYIDFLMQGYAGQLTGKQLESIGYAREGVLGLEKNIAVLMDVAAFDLDLVSPRLLPFDAAAYLRERESSFKPMARMHKIQVHVLLPPHPLMINADKRWFDILVFELITNSIRITPPDSSVTIALHAVRDTVKLVFSLEAVDIKNASLPLFFEPRACQKQPSENTGREISRLRAVRLEHIARLHRGAITLRNCRSSQEMRVTVSFPGEKTP